MKIKITTPYNDVYLVNEKGEISTKQTNWEFSGNWLFLGIKSVKSNLFIPFASLNKDLLKETDLLYKNKRPKFTIRDKDHGTVREYGNTALHGIKYISFLD
jgi:hypothetical protein